MKHVRRSRWHQPGMGLLKRAVLWLVLYGAFRLAGWNEFTDAISGMHGRSWGAFAGLMYMMLHMLVVFFVPPMVLAGFIILALSRRSRVRVNSRPS